MALLHPIWFIISFGSELRLSPMSISLAPVHSFTSKKVLVLRTPNLTFLCKRYPHPHKVTCILWDILLSWKIVDLKYLSWISLICGREWYFKIIATTNYLDAFLRFATVKSEVFISISTCVYMAVSWFCCSINSKGNSWLSANIKLSDLCLVREIVAEHFEHFSLARKGQDSCNQADIEHQP